MKVAAGTLLYRCQAEVLEVLLVHPSGNYNRRAPWSIPKGELDDGEGLETAARRETTEEVGVAPLGLISLGQIDYIRSRKRVHCFAGAAPDDADPCCASWEVDRGEFVAIDKALEIIHPDQKPFLIRLMEHLTAD